MYIQSILVASFGRLALPTVLAMSLLSTPIARAQEKPGSDTSGKIRNSLAEIASQEKLPGMIAAISSSQGVVAMASVGVRKAGSTAEIEEGDLIHIGSCTKAMTSTLLARFVEQDALTWETTLIEIFPEYRNRIHPGYHQITLWQLLTHRAGLPANAKDWWVHPKMELKARRLTVMLENLGKAPKRKTGKFLYSNLGYMIAGCMAEKVSGKSWESLMAGYVFEPLAMDSAGFGPPGTTGKLDQPWGHSWSKGKWQPGQFDNAEALGPAGRVHCSIEDWAKFIALQLPGKPGILDRPSLDQLIKPDQGDYAAGWTVVQRPWAKGTTLTHSGSNTMWFAVVWVAPELDRAFIVATNSSSKKTPKICDKMIGKLIEIDKNP